MTSHYAPPAYRTDQRAPSPSHSRYDSYDAPSVYPQSHAPTIREVHAPSTLARRDTFATLAPGDSISNAPSRLNDDRHVQSDFDEDYLLRDPYARTQTPNDHLAMPYGAPAGHEYDYEPTDDKSHHRYSSYDAPLVANAGPAGGSQHEYEAVNGLEKGGNDYPPPAPNLKSEFGGKRPGLLRRWIRDPTPLEQRVENYKRGIGVQERPWACWIIFIACVAAFLAECASNWKAQGSPIQLKPTFNWIIGPSSSVLINTGARFTPCMKPIAEIAGLPLACPANTANPVDQLCTLEQVCGFGGFGPTGVPDQAFRFILPIFLHGGLLHILVNMLVQLTSSAQVEREMGSPRFLLVYFPAGIFGFVLGGNFALVGQPSVGASGAIFGTHAAVMIDLLSHWSLEPRPKRKLFWLLIEIVIGVALGFIPGVDNFSHIGGFMMGLLTCILFYPAIHRTRRHRLITYGLRILAAPLVIISFVLLVRNFYTNNPAEACHWCRYLSCWPTAANNRCQGNGLAVQSSAVPNRFLL